MAMTIIHALMPFMWPLCGLVGFLVLEGRGILFPHLRPSGALPLSASFF